MTLLDFRLHGHNSFWLYRLFAGTSDKEEIDITLIKEKGKWRIKGPY
jgi:hypothetical protein